MYFGEDLSLMTPAPLGTGLQHWIYATIDTIDEVAAGGYFSDGVSRGLQIGHLLWVIDPDGPSVDLCQVSSVGSHSATVTPIRLGGNTPPGGATGQVQINSSGEFGGVGTIGSGNVVLATSPTVTTGTFSGGTLSGTFAGSPTWSAAHTFSSNVTIRGADANPWQFTGGALSLTGSGNPAMFIKVPGTGSFNFQCNGVTQAQVTPTAATFTPPLRAASTFQSTFSPVYVSGAGIAPGGTNKPILWADFAISGTLDTGISPPGFIRSTDSVAVSSGAPLQVLGINQILNTGFDGFRQTFTVAQTKSVGSVSGGMASNTVVFTAVWNGSEGGVGGSSTDATKWSGGGTLLNLDGTGNVPNGNFLLLQENDIRLRAQAFGKVGLSINYAVNDAFHAAQPSLDAAVAVTKASSVLPGTGGGINAFLIGGYIGAYPMDPSAAASTGDGTSLFRVNMTSAGNQALGASSHPQTYTTSFGIDLRPVDFTQWAWASAGKRVDGNGNTYIGPGEISYDATGLIINAANVTEQTAVVVSGGGGFNNGDTVIYDVTGSQWTVGTVAGAANAAAATLTLLHPGFPSATPATGVSLRGGYGIGLTATISCSSAATIVALQKSGGDVVAGTQSAISTSATGGFFMIPFCAGAPTGAPANKAKGIGLVYDTTNHKLWAYDNGTNTWKGIVLT